MKLLYDNACAFYKEGNEERRDADELWSVFRNAVERVLARESSPAGDSVR